MSLEHRDANLHIWDLWADLHTRESTDAYRLDEFRAGASSLHQPELELVGSVRGLRLLHLQCHFGMDTLSWARQGAIATGVDFSSRAIAHARALSSEVGVPARFIESNVFELDGKLDEQFDVVYTSYGVLCWLQDIDAWGRLIAKRLRPGGVFCMVEFHPILGVFEELPEESGLDIRYSYAYTEEPSVWPIDGGSYAAKSPEVVGHTYEWSHSLAEITTALLSAGLVLEAFREYPYCIYRHFACMRESPDGYWRIAGKEDTIPLMFSIRARKPT